MDALVTATAGRIGRAWGGLLAHLRDANSVDAISARLVAGDQHGAVAGLDRVARAFAAAELGAYTGAGQATAKWVHGQLNPPRARRRVRKGMVVFDAQEPGAVSWARQNQLDKIRQIGDEQRDAIRAAIIEGAQTGANPRDTARRIFDSIGLTDQQEAIVNNYRRELEAGQYAAALQRELSSGHSDKTIAAALRNRSTLTQAQIDTAVERYRDNWITFRSQNIARTEGLRVAHQGSEELYRQAVENGDLNPKQLRRTWNHSPGRLGAKYERSFHKVMQGQTVGYGEVFISGLGAELRYPGDPKASGEETICCACCVSTRIDPAAGGSGSQGMSGSTDEEAGDSDTGDGGDDELDAETEDDAGELGDDATDETTDDRGDIATDDGEPGELSDPFSDDLTEALTTFDFPAATEAIDAELEARGFAPGPTTNEMTTDTTDVGTDGYRGWDGKIVLRPGYARGAFDFAEKWESPTGRAEMTAQTSYDVLSPGVPERGDAIRAILHEHLHGYGPLNEHLYVGYGATAEEVATEMVARAMMRDHFGMDFGLVGDRTYGAYGGYITGTLDAIREVYGSTPEAAWAVLEEASSAYKRVGQGATDLEVELLDAINDAARGTVAERGRLRMEFERRT